MTEDRDLYPTVEAAGLAGVTVRQLRSWADSGYLRPARHNGHGRGLASTVLAWPIGEVDRAEILGVLSRQLTRHDLFGRLSAAIEADTMLILPDGDYEVVIAWHARRPGT